MVLEYNALQTGLTLAPLSLTMFATALIAGKRGGRRPARRHHPRSASALLTVGMLLLFRSSRGRTPAGRSSSR